MKRFLSVIIALILLLSTFVPFVFADDYSSSVRSLWDVALYNLCRTGDGLSTDVSVKGFNLSLNAGNGVANFTSHFSGAICGNSSDHLHHADSLNQWQGNNTENDHGAYAYATCKYCGATFKYYADDLKQDYNNSVHDNNLDNGIAVTPATNDSPSGLIWTPSVPDSACEMLPRTYDGDPYVFSSHSFPYTISHDNYWTFTYNKNGNQFPMVFTSNVNWGDHLHYGVRITLDLPVSGSYSMFPTLWYDRDTQGIDMSYSLDYAFSPTSFLGQKGDSESFVFLTTSGISQRTEYITFDFPSFTVVPSESISVPSVPSTITINNNNYNVTDFNFDLRQYHVTDENNQNITITYEDQRTVIHNEITDETTYNYYTIELDPGNDDPDPGSSTDPGPGDGSSSTSTEVHNGCNWTPEMWERLQVLLRQNNTFLEQIYTELTNISELVGDDDSYDFTGMYNLISDIRDALQNIEDNPTPDYTQKLETISSQLANIWGNVQNIKTAVESLDDKIDDTNDKLDTVHDDLAAVLSELQEQKGILGQILSVLRDLLRHVTNIDANVEDLADEQSQQSFIGGLYRKFGFINQVYAITRQMMADVTNDAVSAQAVSDGVLPALSLTSDHTDPDSSGDSGGSSAQSVNAGSGGAGSRSAGGTAPEVITRFPDVEVMGFNLSSYSAIDLSWYAPYKSEVDTILSGFMYLGYIWLLFKRLPSIIRGGAMASADYEKVQEQWYGKKGD